MNRVFILAYAQVDIKNCTIKIKDGGSNVLTVKIGEGNLTYTEKKPRTYLKDRGKLDSVRNADEEPVDVKLDFRWDFLKSDAADPSGAVVTVEDALKQINGAAAWVTTDSDPCNPYCVDLEITNNPPCASVKNEVITLGEFRHEQLDHDLRAGTVSVTGKCNITRATVTRTAVSTNT